MNTVDNLVLKIVNHSTPTIEECVSPRDARLLRSMANSITGQLFITENQSKLISKVLKENSKKITFFEEEIKTILAAPTWSRTFRQIPEVKKVQVTKNVDGNLVICVECSYSAAIRQKILTLSKNLEGFQTQSAGKVFYADLTEKNIVEIVDALSSLNFDIDEILINHYKTIKSWSKTEVENQFLITNITHQNFHKQIASDIGLDTEATDPIIFDRSIRYQYKMEKPGKITKNLTNSIAYRDQSKIWIDSSKHSLAEVIKSLIELKRLPVMVVFNNVDNKVSVKNLENLSNSLKENNVSNDVGIYFRLPSDDIGKMFNGIVSQNNYNKFLTDTTKVVGIQSGKIPKFFLNSPWKPMSVIFLGGDAIRHNKSAVYANCCDLIISYCEKDPLIVYKPWV